MLKNDKIHISYFVKGQINSNTIGLQEKGNALAIQLLHQT